MSRNRNPLGGFAKSVARGVAVRTVSRLVWMGLVAAMAFFGWQQFGKPSSRESVAQHSAAIVNVNTASVSQLLLLPRVNEALAHRIVASRPYARVDDLLRVSGIGPKTLEGLRSRVVVDGAGQPVK